jgi:hypothetical protein
MLEFGTILVTLTLAAGSLPVGQAPVDDARKKDVYAVYSLAISSTYEQDGNLLYLIEQKTGTTTHPISASGTACVVPPAYQQSWSEAVADFTVRGATSLTLDRSFTLAKPYQLLDEAAVGEYHSQFSVLMLLGQPPVLNPRFQGAKAKYSVSDAFFNKDRTLALVFVRSFCGGLCGIAGWMVFERPVGGDWRAAPLRCNFDMH